MPPLFRVFAVPFAAVRFAGLPLGAHHPVGAATNHALAWTAAVFEAETLGVRVGGAAHHRARLLSAAVFAAIRRCRLCVGGAPFKFARSTRAVLGADTACFSKCGAAFLLAHFLPATAELMTPASGCDGSGALVVRADLFGAMFAANPSCLSDVAAAFARARYCLAVVFSAQPPCARLGGAAVDRAGFAAMCLAELPFASGFVRAATHDAHLPLPSPHLLFLVSQQL